MDYLKVEIDTESLSLFEWLKGQSNELLCILLGTDDDYINYFKTINPEYNTKQFNDLMFRFNIKMRALIYKNYSNFLKNESLIITNNFINEILLVNKPLSDLVLEKLTKYDDNIVSNMNYNYFIDTFYNNEYSWIFKLHIDVFYGIENDVISKFQTLVGTDLFKRYSWYFDTILFKHQLMNYINLSNNVLYRNLITIKNNDKK